MSWTSPSDLRAQVQRLWERGELLRDLASGTLAWPLRMSLRAPSAADLTERFEAVRAWTMSIAQTPHVRIEWREWNHRVQGNQRVPAAAWIDTLQGALAVIGKAGEAKRFDSLRARTAERQPALQPWLARRPLQALELFERWDRLIAIVAWLQAHPRPEVYPRQVDTAGVDSKFIEAHRGVLIELLDLALPPAAIDMTATGVAQFARRYGFREKPVRVRFRLFDGALPGWPPRPDSADVALDVETFATIAPAARRVFITENETNFLAFPALPQTLVIFGAGYGWDALAQVAWLHRCDLRYWGDLDTHGFAILDQLRSHFPQAVSFLMDRETLLAHEAHWGQEPEPVRRDLTRLTAEEASLFDDLRSDRLRPRLRLEQERIGYGWLTKDLGRLPPIS